MARWLRLCLPMQGEAGRGAENPRASGPETSRPVSGTVPGGRQPATSSPWAQEGGQAGADTRGARGTYGPLGSSTFRGSRGT